MGFGVHFTINKLLGVSVILRFILVIFLSERYVASRYLLSIAVLPNTVSDYMIYVTQNHSVNPEQSKNYVEKTSIAHSTRKTVSIPTTKLEAKVVANSRKLKLIETRLLFTNRKIYFCTLRNNKCQPASTSLHRCWQLTIKTNEILLIQRKFLVLYAIIQQTVRMHSRHGQQRKYPYETYGQIQRHQKYRN